MKKLSLFLVARTMLLVSCKPEIEKPTVVTKSVGEVTQNTAKVIGQVTADGGSEVTERGVCWNTEGLPTILDFSTKDGNGIGSFTSNITDIVPNTQYYVRAYATNEAGVSYGEEKTFTTLDDMPEDPNQPEEGTPEVKTAEVTEITLSSAVSGGEVTFDGNATIIARGVCWSTSHNPTIEGNKTIDGSGTGSFTSKMTNLEQNTTYYVRAYAANVKGITAYGEEVSFTTLAKLLPTVTTMAEVTEITINSAVCGGEVTFDGNLETTRGICWSTSQNPTIEDNKTIDGSGIGSYTSEMTDLDQNTTYYVRAYATNEVGTVYGEEVSFTTENHLENGYEYVDLGLSVKWATCNVGANSPEEYGEYFAWGETVAKEECLSSNSPTYGLGVSELQSYGYIDGEGALTSQYDAARANWGGAWRLPTEAEMQELLDECTFTWTTHNGVDGCKVEGPSGASIFLPAAGGRDGAAIGYEGGFGFYWSSMPNEYWDDEAYILKFSYNDIHEIGGFNRYYGLSVRPVLE